MASPKPDVPRVLIVEDFADTRDMYEFYLVQEGFRVLTAEDAPTAIALTLEHRPDLIFMDAGLPGMSGWEAVKTLKSDSRVCDIPILMLTGHVLPDSRDRADAAGADGFIAKPCLPDDLVKAIHDALSAGTRTGEHERLRQRTAELAAEHAGLSRKLVPFDQANHDRHARKLREHRKDLQRHAKRAKKP